MMTNWASKGFDWIVFTVSFHLRVLLESQSLICIHIYGPLCIYAPVLPLTDGLMNCTWRFLFSTIADTLEQCTDTLICLQSMPSVICRCKYGMMYPGACFQEGFNAIKLLFSVIPVLHCMTRSKWCSESWAANLSPTDFWQRWRLFCFHWQSAKQRLTRVTLQLLQAYYLRSDCGATHVTARQARRERKREREVRTTCQWYMTRNWLGSEGQIQGEGYIPPLLATDKQNTNHYSVIRGKTALFWCHSHIFPPGENQDFILISFKLFSPPPSSDPPPPIQHCL